MHWNFFLPKWIMFFVPTFSSFWIYKLTLESLACSLCLLCSNEDFPNFFPALIFLNYFFPILIWGTETLSVTTEELYSLSVELTIQNTASALTDFLMLVL